MKIQIKSLEKKHLNNSNDWENHKLGDYSLSLLKDGTHGTHADTEDGQLHRRIGRLYVTTQVFSKS